MTEYHPPQRQIGARVHTSAGWLNATFHMPLLHGFLDFLNQRHAFVKLTQARLPGSPEVTEFAAVRKTGILAIMPEGPEDQLQLAKPTVNVETRQVSCLLDTGLVLGTLEMREHTRVSDFLLHHPGFFLLRKAVVYDERTKRHISSPIALINAEHVVAVSERELS